MTKRISPGGTKLLHHKTACLPRSLPAMGGMSSRPTLSPRKIYILVPCALGGGCQRPHIGALGNRRRMWFPCLATTAPSCRALPPPDAVICSKKHRHTTCRKCTSRGRRVSDVGTATTTADAADYARGRRRMAPRRCRAASACHVPPQPAIARPGAGRHRTAFDRGCGCGQARAIAALRSLRARAAIITSVRACAAGRFRYGSTRDRSRSTSRSSSSKSRCGSADCWHRPRKTMWRRS